MMQGEARQNVWIDEWMVYGSGEPMVWVLGGIHMKYTDGWKGGEVQLPA